MMRYYCVIVVCLLLHVSVFANNVRVKNLQWDANTVNSQDVLTMTFNVSWENSWRDDYNYDAAYVFFKFRRVDAVNESWHHLYLQDAGNKIGKGSVVDTDYDCWVSPLSQTGANMNTGIYIFRKEEGNGGNSVDVTVKWDIKKQAGISLNSSEFTDHKILISAFAVEMVYVPRGPFRVGDGQSAKSFRKAIAPILPEYDLMDAKYTFDASTGDPRLAADRVNDNTANANNSWVGSPNIMGSPTEKNASYWTIDFGAGNEKMITYFGVNGAKYQPTYYPKTFRLQGASSVNGPWKDLWTGSGKDNWNVLSSAYPVEKSIKILRPELWRCYRLRIDEMNAGYPIVSSIGMTDQNLDAVLDHTVVVDGPIMIKDTLRYLGARDGSAWTGVVPETFPDGYKGFYAMKYEISQEQYVRFLNKLSYEQQNGLLEGRLEQIEEGKYIFGDDKHPDHRNGIVLFSEMEGRSAVFSNNLNLVNEAGKDDDGQNIACNYMSINDMLAYADWSGLRPLTEMEYEKMSRPLYPYKPPKGEYAWNSTRIVKAETLYEPGFPGERTMTGNANYDNATNLGGPLRSGAFASDNSDRENAGAGYWGGMELSGNLSEMYYNVNNLGMTLLMPETGSGNALNGHRTSHGDGYVSTDGHYNATVVSWKDTPMYIALRGGSYASGAAELTTSDRTYHMDALASKSERLPTVSFRLGRSVPEQSPIVSSLLLENEESTQGKKDVQDVGMENRTEAYTITGNLPDKLKENVYTYIWYMKEYGDADWRIMEGENDKDLVFDRFRADTVNTQVYSFRRKVVTPFADSDKSSEYKVEIMITKISLPTPDFSMYSTEYSSQDELTVVSLRASTFRWEYNGAQLLPTAETQYRSSYRPMRGHFGNLGEAADYVVTLKINNVKASDIRVHVEQAARVYASNNVACGKIMYDARDNQTYGTVQIGGQCWMTENMRYNSNAMTGGSGNTPLNGYYYTWLSANGRSGTSGSKQGICPAGWRLPTSAEWQTLINFVGNDSRKLKASSNWQYVNDSQRGNNSTGFSAVGSGVYYNNPSSWGYNQQRIRFETSERDPTWNDGVYVELYYNNTNATIVRPTGQNWWDTEAGSVRCVK